MDPVTLILTNSRDTTVDWLVAQIGTERVFRLNVDLWEDYRIVFGPEGFHVTNPVGRWVAPEHVKKALWRKPVSIFKPGQEPKDPEDVYREKEMLYVLEEIKNFLWREGKLVLVEPHADGRVGKLLQLEVAQQFFRIPAYVFFSGAGAREPGKRDRIVKSLSSSPIAEDRFLWTTPVKEETLDPRGPWFIQDRVEAEFDVTAVFVRDRLFAFSLDRRFLENRTLDWREIANDIQDEWRPHDLPGDLAGTIFRYMETLGLHYGRLDFLLSRNTYHFLEINSNGEWGWLDPDGKAGILLKIVEEIDPRTMVCPIPRVW